MYLVSNSESIAFLQIVKDSHATCILSSPPEVDLPLEALFAESAGEGLVAGVLAHVRDEVGGLAERLRAHHALVRFFA